ncbi:MAG: class I SAM-dependent methyltransferase [Deltaproteobacteria bacterium]|nr:class I SAM-dependent methyltransferase [Deltaproteobacteria bacterium]
MMQTRRLPAEALREEVPCDLCGGCDLEVWDWARGNRLVRCRGCGLVFTSPRLADPEQKGRLLYGSSYFEPPSRHTPQMQRARARCYAAEAELLERRWSGGRILEVGCGQGYFLASLGGQWEKHGSDISTYALEGAARRGVRVHLGELENLEFGDLIFDVICFRASLHHAYSPRRALLKARSLLAPGGGLAITMSNHRGGPCGALFRGRVRSYEQGHNYLFSRPTLAAYLVKAGFQLLETHYPYFGTGYESWRDFAALPRQYARLWAMRWAGRQRDFATQDLASPPFWGNYLNLVARRTDHENQS